MNSWCSICSLLLFYFKLVKCNPDANRLFEDILNDYNKLVRPVIQINETVTVKFKLKLSQLLDVHEKNQIMTTNVWLEHSWIDYKLVWDPSDYGDVEVLYVPSDMIWLPDIVLYNNADGNYQVTIMTKAKLWYNGTVEWTPPAIYKSMCQIDIEWFPFDNQTCEMRFGSWTYNGLEVDLKHKDDHLQIQEKVHRAGRREEEIWTVEEGVDLSDFYQSVEWDILAVPGIRNQKWYSCCEYPYIDITYEIQLRRKTLFYTINLICPAVLISILTALVFYLPSDSGEKISLCISILISLTVFFLLLVEIIPSTSLVVPLVGKYLLFNMVLVTVSVIVTVVALNVHFRSPTTHTMPTWIRKIFIDILPRVLKMQRPTEREQQEEIGNPLLFEKKEQFPTGKKFSVCDPLLFRRPTSVLGSALVSGMKETFAREHTPMRMAIEGACYVADHLKSGEDDDQVIEDWKYVAMVLDRLFLWIFTITCAVGTFSIILRAPRIHDSRVALR